MHFLNFLTGLPLARAVTGQTGRNPGTNGDYWLARSVESAIQTGLCQGETGLTVAPTINVKRTSCPLLFGRASSPTSRNFELATAKGRARTPVPQWETRPLPGCSPLIGKLSHPAMSSLVI